MTVCRVYSNFTLETILATAFGRRINLQRGESDQFSKSMELLLSGFTDGQFEQFVLFHSKFTVHVRIDHLAVLVELNWGVFRIDIYARNFIEGNYRVRPNI